MWIARDKQNKLYAFTFKPTYNNIYKDMWFDVQTDSWGELIIEDIPEVTFENSPIKVKLILVNNE